MQPLKTDTDALIAPGAVLRTHLGDLRGLRFQGF
jgi:hypothetical protein